MKALVEFEFLDDNVYGENRNEELPSDEYNQLSSFVDSVVIDAINRILDVVNEEIGINDLDINNITDEDTGTFSYVLSTGFPKNSAFNAFDLFDRELKNLLVQYKDYTDTYNLKRIAWREFTDGNEIECPHEYETVHFIAVQNDVREIKTCKHCKQSIAKLVKLVNED